MAQIAMLLHNSNVKTDHRKKLDEFLLFETVQEKPVDEDIDASARGVFDRMKMMLQARGTPP